MLKSGLGNFLVSATGMAWLSGLETDVDNQVERVCTAPDAIFVDIINDFLKFVDVFAREGVNIKLVFDGKLPDGATNIKSTEQQRRKQ